MWTLRKSRHKIVTMCRATVAFLLIVIASLSCRAQSVADEKEELQMGNAAILTSLAAFSSSPTLWHEHPAVCSSANGIELGTALIAARNSAQSLQSLARLHRFVLDGGYGETFDRYLCQKGRRLEKYVAELKPEDLRNQCVQEFQKAVKANSEELGQARLDSVCAKVANIRSHLSESLEMVQHPRASCEP